MQKSSCFCLIYFAAVSSSSYPATERLWSDRPRQRQARPFTGTTRRPVASATRPSSQMAVGTRARTARPSSALAVGGACPCDPTRWGKVSLSQHTNTYFYPCEVAHSNIANIKPALTKVWCSILHTCFNVKGKKNGGQKIILWSLLKVELKLILLNSTMHQFPDGAAAVWKKYSTVTFEEFWY